MLFAKDITPRHGVHKGHKEIKNLNSFVVFAPLCLRVRSSILLSSFLIFLLSCASTPQTGIDPAYVPKKPDTESSYPPEPMGDKTAFEYITGERLVGWNLGNTLDSWYNGTANETIWGNPRANEAIFAGVKAAGFNIVRIPVTWMGHIGPAPDFHIEEAYLKRVAEVIGYAKSAGFKVIINLHHDGSTQDSGKDNGWLSINIARGSEEGYRKVTMQYIRVWKQIATYFKNYGDWLIFESLNEVHDGGWGWSAETASQYDIVNEWNQFFTNTVRSAGANNETRYLLYNGYCATPRHALSGNFALPVDSVPNRQIVSFHYYDPHEFGIVGDGRNGRSDWGSDQDKAKVANDFAQFKAKFINNNIPVIIGESGAVRQVYLTDKEKENRARQARLDYVAWVYARAAENSLVPVYWDNGLFSGSGEKFGLFDRNTGKVNSDESQAVVNAIMGAIK
jgi:endoglucanase